MLGLFSSSVSNVCKGKSQTAGGYTFEYVPQTEVLESEEWRSVDVTML
jgi:hypothetical protein